MGALRARSRFAAITGSNFRIESYPLLASSQHVGATVAVTILLFSFLLFEANSELMKIPYLKTKMQRMSISYRGTKLYNLLKQNFLMPNEITNFSQPKIQSVAHRIRDLFILSNEELIKFIFCQN